MSWIRRFMVMMHIGYYGAQRISRIRLSLNGNFIHWKSLVYVCCFLRQMVERGKIYSMLPCLSEMVNIHSIIRVRSMRYIYLISDINGQMNGRFVHVIYEKAMVCI